MKVDLVCDQMITARSAFLLAERITALFGRLKTDFMVSSCNKPDWGYFPFRLAQLAFFVGLTESELRTGVATTSRLDVQGPCLS